MSINSKSFGFFCSWILSRAWDSLNTYWNPAVCKDLFWTLGKEGQVSVSNLTDGERWPVGQAHMSSPYRRPETHATLWVFSGDKGGMAEAERAEVSVSWKGGAKEPACIQDMSGELGLGSISPRSLDFSKHRHNANIQKGGSVKMGSHRHFPV